MKKKVLLKVLPVFLFVVFLIIVVPETSAGFEFEKKAIHDVIPAENISIPASYYLTIENTNESNDNFTIYSWVVELEPAEPFEIEAGEEVTITVTILPSVGIKETCGLGSCAIEYYINSELSDPSDAIRDSLRIKIVPIDEIIEITMPEVITRDDVSFSINVTNKENIDLEKISINADWNFCNVTKNTSLQPKSSIVLVFDLDKSKIEMAEAGNYTIKLTITVNNEYSYVIEEQIMLEEFASITTTESTKRGFLGYTKIITKKNEGNSAKLVTIEVTKGNFEKMFTRYSIEAAYENPVDGAAKIGWQRELEPGESFTVELTTNYSWFVLILIIIIVGAATLYLVKRPRIIIKKKAYKVKTKGGEFALKLLIVVKNVGLEVSDAKCIDYIPKLTKIHERFGTVKPDVVTRDRLEWNFGGLAPSEERIVSYIIYSEVMPVGAVKLPKATLSYVDATGKKHTLFSNIVSALGAA